MGLRDTYAYAIQTAKGKFNGNAEERDGKLYFKGTVATEAQKNEIWKAIKTIPTWQNDIVADIQVTGGPDARRGPGKDLHGPVRRHAQQDCQGTPRRRERLHEDLRSQQGPADQSRPDQARPGSPLALSRGRGIRARTSARAGPLPALAALSLCDPGRTDAAAAAGPICTGPLKGRRVGLPGRKSCHGRLFPDPAVLLPVPES